MDLITMLIVGIIIIAILGVIVWYITTVIPMPAPFRYGIYALAAIIVLLLLLKLVLGGLPPLLILPLARHYG